MEGACGLSSFMYNIRMLSVLGAYLYFKKLFIYLCECTCVIFHGLCVYRSFWKSEEGMGSLTLEIIVGPRVGYENGIWLFSRALPELSSHHISDFSSLCFSDTGRFLVAVLWWVRAFFVFCVASVHWVEDDYFLTTPVLNVIRHPCSFCTSALLDSWYEGQSALTEVMECPTELVLSLTGAFEHWSSCHSIAEAVSVFGMYGTAVISHGIQSLSSLALFGYVWERTVSNSKNFFYKLSVWKNENINDFNKIRVIEKNSQSQYYSYISIKHKINTLSWQEWSPDTL